MARQKRERTATSDWKSLPGDLVQLIADKLSAVEDFVALTSVCRSFRSSAKKDEWRPLEPSRPPWLLLCGMYEMTAVSMYNKKKKEKWFDMNLPELHLKHCFGTTYGWIVTLGRHLQLHLFNPLNRRRIALPPHNNKYVLKFIERAILIKRPSFVDDDFVVVVTGMFGRKLSVTRPQQSTWETIDVFPTIGLVCDIAYYKGQIYVVDYRSRIYTCTNLDGPGPLTVMKRVSRLCTHQLLNFPDNLYLLESLGDLLLVARYRNQTRRTCAFDVFKLNHQTHELVQVEDLGDRCLFVGNCQSISLSPSETFHCRSNCIYFTPHEYSSGMSEVERGDMGVFDLKRRTIRLFFRCARSLALSSAATWFTPTFS